MIASSSGCISSSSVTASNSDSVSSATSMPGIVTISSSSGASIKIISLPKYFSKANLTDSI